MDAGNHSDEKNNLDFAKRKKCYCYKGSKHWQKLKKCHNLSQIFEIPNKISWGNQEFISKILGTPSSWRCINVP